MADEKDTAAEAAPDIAKTELKKPQTIIERLKEKGYQVDGDRILVATTVTVGMVTLGKSTFFKKKLKGISKEEAEEIAKYVDPSTRKPYVRAFMYKYPSKYNESVAEILPETLNMRALGPEYYEPGPGGSEVLKSREEVESIQNTGASTKAEAKAMAKKAAAELAEKDGQNEGTNKSFLQKAKDKLLGTSKQTEAEAEASKKPNDDAAVAEAGAVTETVSSDPAVTVDESTAATKASENAEVSAVAEVTDETKEVFQDPDSLEAAEEEERQSLMEYTKEELTNMADKLDIELKKQSNKKQIVEAIMAVTRA